MVRKIHIDAIRERAQALAKEFGADPERIVRELTQAHVRHRVPLEYPAASLTVMMHSNGASELLSHGPMPVRRFNSPTATPPDFKDTIQV